MDSEMLFIEALSSQEAKILNRVSTYFRSPKMDLADKLIQARLIALHDMELGYFSNPKEFKLLQTYAETLDHLLARLQRQPADPPIAHQFKYLII